MTNDNGFPDDAHELSGAYALNAVDQDEARHFERAASASPALGDEADEFAETASLLGLATTPVAPSSQMKADIMAKIAVTPQRAATPAVPEPRRTAPAPDQSADPAAPVGAEPVGTDPAGPEPAGVPIVASGRVIAHPAGGRIIRFPRPVRYLAAAAAAVALFVGGGVVTNALNSPGGVNQAAPASTLADILARGDAQKVSEPVGDGATATLVWSASLARSVVLVDKMPALTGDKVYEAWYIDDSGAKAAGTFHASASSPTVHVLAGAMTAGAAVGVTVEPAGGSAQPTTQPVMVLKTA